MENLYISIAAGTFLITDQDGIVLEMGTISALGDTLSQYFNASWHMVFRFV